MTKQPKTEAVAQPDLRVLSADDESFLSDLALGTAEVIEELGAIEGRVSGWALGAFGLGRFAATVRQLEQITKALGEVVEELHGLGEDVAEDKLTEDGRRRKVARRVEWIEAFMREQPDAIPLIEALREGRQTSSDTPPPELPPATSS